MTSERKSFLISLSAHIAVVGAIAGFGFFSSLAGTPEEFSPNDDIVLILGDDPNKDAGLVDRERGAAKGTADGKINDPREAGGNDEKEEEIIDEDFEDNSELEEIIRQNEEALKAAQAAEAAAREQAKEQAKPVPAPPKKPAPTTKKTPPKKTDSKKNNGSGPKKVNINQHRKKNGGNAKNSGGKSRVPVKIKVGSVGDGNGSGTGAGKGGKSGGVFGRPDGTGENGGDGGRRIGDARVAYCGEIDARFTQFFNQLYPTAQLELTGTVFVDVRFSVDANGNVKFLEVVGSSNPSIRKFIDRVFKTAFPSRFKKPPENKGFNGKLEKIKFGVG